ncbi:MAG: hypothetical protein WKF97_07310 [Chitinophagaceae bacterium]
MRNAINVAPLNNVPGAVVTLMDRSNVETVIVAGKIRKWKGLLMDADIAKLRPLGSIAMAHNQKPKLKGC